VLSWLANAWRVPELRRRVLFTAMVLALYRLGSFIPAPGVDSSQISGYFNQQGGTVLGLLNLFSGTPCRGSRSSRSGSCRTSRRRSSCS
jgi:preprotein translocase subunit SecY